MRKSATKSKTQVQTHRRVILKGAIQGLGVMMMGCGRGQRRVPEVDQSRDRAISLESGAFRPSQGLRNIGELGRADQNGIRLPPGFRSSVVARGGSAPIKGGTYRWHSAADGGAVFPGHDEGWIYLSNCEEMGTGGVGALAFNAEGRLVDAYSILTKTNRNCGGGATPQGTWLSCEEVTRGRVIECDPFAKRRPEERLTLGVFNHEATAHDLSNQHVYLTEDEVDGRLYRFVPDRLDAAGFADLSSGRLEVAQVANSGKVSWHKIPDPTYSGGKATRYQVPGSTKFNGGEGIWWDDGHLYFSTKGDERIWDLDIKTSTIRVHYDAKTAKTPILTGVDGVIGSPGGELLVAEDGGDMQVVMILPDGSLKPLLQIVGHPGSEVTGLAFDPSGTRMYFSSQRGEGMGVTYEMSGPFHDKKS